MIVDGDKLAARRLYGCADGFNVHMIDKGIVDDRCLHAFGGQLFTRFDDAIEQHAATHQHHVAAFLQHLRFTPIINGILHPTERIIFATHKENVTLAILARRTISLESFDGLIHKLFRFIGTRRHDHHRVRDGTYRREIRCRLMTRAIGRILKTHVTEHRNHRPLAERGHRERQVAFGDTELAEGVHNGNETHFAHPRSGANHIRFSNAHLDEATGKGFLVSTDARGTLNVR